MVCHDRLTEWDAHPRRSVAAIVDDRILTSCAAVRARMDGWWTLAVGTTVTNARLLLDKEVRTNDEDCLDTRDRSHGSITRSARSNSDGGMVRPSALATFMLIASSNFV